MPIVGSAVAAARLVADMETMSDFKREVDEILVDLEGSDAAPEKVSADRLEPSQFVKPEFRDGRRRNGPGRRFPCRRWPGGRSGGTRRSRRDHCASAGRAPVRSREGSHARQHIAAGLCAGVPCVNPLRCPSSIRSLLSGRRRESGGSTAVWPGLPAPVACLRKELWITSLPWRARQRGQKYSIAHGNTGGGWLVLPRT